jgi:hypothetical protein
VLYPFLGSRTPLVRFGAFRGSAVRCLSFLWSFAMSSFSLSPLSFVSWSRSSVVVSRLGWDAASRSILLWVTYSSVPLVCRTRGADPEMVAGLVALLRKSRDLRMNIVLGVRQGWDGSRWFCAATDIPAIDDVAVAHPTRLMTLEEIYESCPRKNTCDSESCSC